LALYFWALKEEFKLDKAGYIVLDKKKPGEKVQVLIDLISGEQELNVVDRFDKVNYSITEGKFEANKKACFGKFGRCQYFAFCHKGDKSNLEDVKHVTRKTSK
jgi:hypothetical protein